MVIIVFGLPGSGKTYFARQLATNLKAKYINSDTVRNSFRGPGEYSREEKNIVYDIMLNKMMIAMHEGEDVVIDATFYKNDLRRRFSSYIRETGSPYFIEIVADELLIRKRLAKRTSDPASSSHVYEAVKAEWEPAPFPHLTIESTDDNVGEMLEKAMAYITPDERRKEKISGLNRSGL